MFYGWHQHLNPNRCWRSPGWLDSHCSDRLCDWSKKNLCRISDSLIPVVISQCQGSQAWSFAFQKLNTWSCDISNIETLMTAGNSSNLKQEQYIKMSLINFHYNRYYIFGDGHSKFSRTNLAYPFLISQFFYVLFWCFCVLFCCLFFWRKCMIGWHLNKIWL